MICFRKIYPESLFVSVTFDTNFCFIFSRAIDLHQADGAQGCDGWRVHDFRVFEQRPHSV